MIPLPFDTKGFGGLCNSLRARHLPLLPSALADLAFQQDASQSHTAERFHWRRDVVTARQLARRRQSRDSVQRPQHRILLDQVHPE